MSRDRIPAPWLGWAVLAGLGLFLAWALWVMA